MANQLWFTTRIQEEEEEDPAYTAAYVLKQEVTVWQIWALDWHRNRIQNVPLVFFAMLFGHFVEQHL